MDGCLRHLPNSQQDIQSQQDAVHDPKHNPCIHNDVPLSKKTTTTEAMVLPFISDSREISFRLDDCLSRKTGRLLPIGVKLLYNICVSESTLVEKRETFFLIRGINV
jgi:hypothetical protein